MPFPPSLGLTLPTIPWPHPSYHPLLQVRAGSTLTKYNQRDGRASQRWVKVVGHLGTTHKVLWGDKGAKSTSELDLSNATSLHHGAKSAAFYKQVRPWRARARAPCMAVRVHPLTCAWPSTCILSPCALHAGRCCEQGGRSVEGAHDPWQCFSIYSRERSLDLAAETADDLLDWYLALASLMPHSTEPLLDEAALRARIQQMGNQAGGAGALTRSVPINTSL